MAKIFLALGSNIGNKEVNIARAISLLSENISCISKAKLYHSKAAGYENQNDFVNTVIAAHTNLSPTELLHFVKFIEKKVGRIFRFHWGPREIDIDIIFYDNLIIKSEELEIPHKRMHERDFVLRPIIDIEPEFKHPIFNQTVSQLYGGLDKSQLTIIE